ncbi:putative aspartyl-tRNA synthetase [Streptococcus gordonii]|jgi:hypothetical protein|nr:hypothetical protein [Streptococcus gordonii]MCC3175806.1 putative aspartyl-tRNA synthetase [Streptococcus gordonii]QGS43888.1 hypothetical protein FOB91_03825 [Streptococcus gordonii]
MNAFLWFLLPMIFFFWLDSSSKLRRMQGRVKSLEKYRKGEKTMSRFLKEMIGKKPMITSELIGTNDWLVVDVDEDWVKLSKTDKKGQKKTKLMRIEDIRSVELLEN